MRSAHSLIDASVDLCLSHTGYGARSFGCDNEDMASALKPSCSHENNHKILVVFFKCST